HPDLHNFPTRRSSDPSLPAVLGNRDALIQAFLNLVKNATEAVPSQGGEIQISTAYQHGVRLAVSGTDTRLHLPLVVKVADNGERSEEHTSELQSLAYL